MPRVSTLRRRAALYQYQRDHDPPHFHVFEANGSEALLLIRDFSVYRGKISPSCHREVIDRASRHHGALALDHVMAKANRPIQPIGGDEEA